MRTNRYIFPAFIVRITIISFWRETELVIYPLFVQEENLKYIEDETGAEVVAAPQKDNTKTEVLLCARYKCFEITSYYNIEHKFIFVILINFVISRHKTVESLNRAVYLLERLQESVRIS